MTIEKPTMSKPAPLVFLLGACLALSGCLSVGKGDTTIYSPERSAAPQDGWPAVDWPLVVMKPLASDAIDSPRIAVRPRPGTLQVYKDAAWSDSVPHMLQTAVVTAFEDSGKIASVGRQASGVRGDYALLLDIRRYEAIYGDPKLPPTITLEVQAKLLGNPSSRVIAARTFKVERPAASEKVPAVVAAFDSANQELVGEIVGWTLSQDPKPRK